ncbi:hypothetical protein Hanom_Chr14g01247921 [Helianthus anomalus]
MSCSSIIDMATCNFVYMVLSMLMLKKQFGLRVTFLPYCSVRKNVALFSYGEVLPIIPLLCLRAGGRSGFHASGREPRGYRWSSSRRWPQRPLSWWLASRSLPFKKKVHVRLNFSCMNPNIEIFY